MNAFQAFQKRIEEFLTAILAESDAVAEIELVAHPKLSGFSNAWCPAVFS